MADDFSLKFGSNAKQFARDLDRELAPVVKSIQEITESVRLFEQASGAQKTGSNAFVEQLAGISQEIKEQALEARKDVGSTTQALRSASAAIQGMQQSIQSLLELFKNVGTTADQAAKRATSARVAGTRSRQTFDPADSDNVLGVRGTANPFSRRTTGLSEGIQRLGANSETAGRQAREGAQAIGALRDALRGMVRAAPGAIDAVEGRAVTSGGQVNLTSDVIVGLAQAIRENTVALGGETVAERENTVALKEAVKEQPKNVRTLSDRELDEKATSGRFVLPGGDQRSVGFNTAQDETFRQFFARQDSNFQAEREALRGVQLTNAQNARVLESFSRREIDRLRNPQGVIQPEAFERFRVAGKGIAEADIDKIPAALRDLAREEQERDQALLGLIRQMLAQNPKETFAGMSRDVQRLVKELDAFVIRQVNSRNDLLENGQVGNSRFRARGTPTFETPENLEALRAGAELRNQIRAETEKFVAGRNALTGGFREADQTDFQGRPVGLRAQQKNFQQTAEVEAANAAAKLASKAEDDRRAAETQIQVLERRAQAARDLIAALNGLAQKGAGGRLASPDDRKAVQTQITALLDPVVSALRTQRDRLGARQTAVNTALDDSPKAQQAAQRREQEIDRLVPLLQQRTAAAQEALELAKRENTENEQIVQSRAKVAAAEKQRTQLLSEAKSLTSLGTVEDPRRGVVPVEGPITPQAGARLGQITGQVDQLAAGIAPDIERLSAGIKAETAARDRINNIENQIAALLSERQIQEERANRTASLRPQEEAKLRAEASQLARRINEVDQEIRALNPRSSGGGFTSAGSTRNDEALGAALEKVVQKTTAQLAERTAALNAPPPVTAPDRTVGQSQKVSRSQQQIEKATSDEAISIDRKVQAQRREVTDLERRAARAQTILTEEDSSDKQRKSATNRLSFATDRLEKARTRLAALEEQAARVVPAAAGGSGGSRRGGTPSAQLPSGGGVVDVRVVAVTAEAARALGGGRQAASRNSQASESDATAIRPPSRRAAVNASQTLGLLSQIDEATAQAGAQALKAAVSAGEDSEKAAKALEQRMLAALEIVKGLSAKGVQTRQATSIAATSVGFAPRTEERAQFTQLAKNTIDLTRVKKDAKELADIFNSLDPAIRASLVRVQKDINSGLIPTNVVTRELLTAYQQFVSSPLLQAMGITSKDTKRLFAQMFNLPPGVASTVASQSKAQLTAAGEAAGKNVSTGFQSFIDRTLRAGSFFSVRSLAGSVVFGLENVFREAFTTALNAQTEFVRVSDALKQVGVSAVGLKADFQGISRDLGISLDDVQKSASQLVGVFNDRKSLVDATRTVAELQLISNGALNADEAFKSLTAVASAFNLKTAGDLEHIADVATALQNTLGTNVEDTLEGVGRLGAVANQYGLSLEKIAALTATASKFTGQSGQTVSEQLGRVLALFNTPKVQTLLSGALKGVSVQQFATPNGTGDAITKLIQQFDGLTQAQQSAILKTLGGQRQFAILAAILGNSAEAMRAMTAAQNSTGVAASRVQQLMGTLRKEIDRLKASLVTLISALADAGLFGVLTVVAKAINGLLSGVASLVTVFNNLTNNPIGGFLKKVTLAILLMAAAWKVAGAAANFFRKDATTAAASGIEQKVAASAPAPNVRPSGLIVPSGFPATNISTVETGARVASDNLRGVSQSVEKLGVAGGLAGRGLRAGASGIDGLGRAASNLSTRATATSEKLGSFSAATAGVDAALLAGTIIFASYINQLQQEAQIRSTIAQSIKARIDAGPEGNKQNDNKKSLDEAEQTLKDAKATQNGFFHTLGIGMAGIVNVVKASAHTTGFNREELDRALGNGTSLDDVKAFNKAIADFQKHVTDQFAKHPGKNAQTSGRLQAELLKQAQGIIDLIGNNPEAQALANQIIDQMLTKISARGAAAKVAVDGLGEISSVTQDQLDGLSGLVDGLQGLNSGTLASQAANIASIISNLDIGNNPQIRQLIQKLASSGTSTAEGRRIKVQLDKAMIAFQTQIADQNAGIDPTASQAAYAKALALNTTLMTDIQAVNQGAIDTLKRLGENQAALGNNKSAASTLLSAIAKNRQNANQFSKGSDGFNAAVDADKELRKEFTDALFADQLTAAKAAVASASSDSAKQAANKALADLQVKIAKSSNDIPDLMKRLQEREQALAFKRAKETALAAVNSQPADVSAQVDAAVSALKASLGLKDPTPENLRTIRINEARLALAAARAGELAASEAVALEGEIGIFDKALIAAGQKTAAAAAGLEAATGSTGKVKLPKSTIGAGSPVVAASDLSDLQNSAGGAGDNAKQASDLQEQINQAKAAARIAGIRNPLAKLQAQLNEALRQEAVARAKGRQGLPEYYQAVAQEKELRQNIADLLFSMADQQRSIAIAVAEAGGQTVRAARLRLRQAQVDARRARRVFGANSAEAAQAEQQVISLQASARDAVLSDQLDSIDFNLEFNKITAQQAIKELQDILTQKNLTKQQRRDLMRRIKGIQDEINSQNSGQFNIGDILLPTIYEVRRSAQAAKAGVNYQETNNTTNNVNVDGADTAKVIALITSLLGRQATSRSGTTTGKVV